MHAIQLPINSCKLMCATLHSWVHLCSMALNRTNLGLAAFDDLTKAAERLTETGYQGVLIVLRSSFSAPN